MAIARGLRPSGSRSVFLREYFERQYFCQIHDVLFQFDDVASYQRVEQFVSSRARSTRYIACSIITIPRTLHGLNDLCRANRQTSDICFVVTTGYHAQMLLVSVTTNRLTV
jgi:hypothetical protein